MKNHNLTSEKIMLGPKVILGWGSLIWDPRELAVYENDWIYDGPILPIEFARISSDGRLTLVITENGTEVKTFAAISNIYTNLDDMIENLRKREKCKKEHIGYYIKETDTFYPEDFKFKENIRSWAIHHKITITLWTNLPEKWEYENEEKQIIKISPEERIDYLKNLTGEKRIETEKYIRKTPVAINTKYRELIEKELNWIGYNEPINVKKKEKLFFSKASGSGIISCNKCFYSESILGFIHGYDFSNGKRCGTEGFQCQTCGKFHTIKSYEHENYVLKNCDCGGNISRKEFIFCPKCKSDDIEYQNKYLT